MVADMDRAVAFYQGSLGLELLNRYGDHYAEIQAPDLLIGLHPASEKTVVGNNMSIGLGVTDFDGTIRGNGEIVDGRLPERSAAGDEMLCQSVDETERIGRLNAAG